MRLEEAWSMISLIPSFEVAMLEFDQGFEADFLSIKAPLCWLKASRNGGLVDVAMPLL